MLRSMYAAVSGVKAHQTYLDVTGNNIANVNTVGFKRDVIHFRDMIYQTIKNPSQPDSGIPIGGVNPAQVGLGVSIGSIETVHTQGSLQNTGIPTDMAIQGSGFFVVRSGGQQFYTRAGNFALDRDGNLVMQGNGYLVQGYAYRDMIDPATGNLVRQKDPALTNINIPIGQKIPAKATTLAAFRCNLCSTAKASIPDLTSIPGGVAKLKRPHDYEAWGGVGVTFIGETADRVPGLGNNGDTFFDTDVREVWIKQSGVWVKQKDADPETYYYAKNTATGATEPTYIYTDGVMAAPRAAVAGRITVDYSGSGAPVSPIVLPTTYKAGETYLDLDDGKIYRVNSTGTGWIEHDEVPEDYACAVKDTETIYVWNNDVPQELFPAPGDQVLDMSNGNKNVFKFDNSKGGWISINNTQNSPTALSPSSQSTTTQAVIEEFGKNIIAAHDYEDKFTVYDSKGIPYTMVVVFRKAFDRPADPTGTPPVGAESEWDWYAYYTDSKGNVMPQYGQGAGTLVFGDDGLVKRTYTYEPAQPPVTNATNAPSASQYVPWTVIEKICDPADPRSKDDESKPTALVVADFNVAGSQGSVNNSVNPPTYGSNMIRLDFLGSEYAKTLGLSNERIDGVTNFGSPSTTKMYAQDGYAMGVLENWSIGADGTIVGSYSNGRVLPIAQLALAMFANPQGLSQIGETCFAETINSGIAQIGNPMTNGAGSIVGNTIEMSNVDLSEEFVNLIRAQRGFQANTRVVTTSDQVLEELINMKR